MFIADFLCVNYVFKIHHLLMFMLTEYKYLTSHLTFIHYLHITYERRKKASSQNKKQE